MTKKEFFEKLAEVKDKFKWDLNPGHIIRGRLKIHNQNTPNCEFCPIEAVYYSSLKKKSEYTALYLKEKGEYLDLSSTLMYNIIKAADYNGQFAKQTYKQLKKILS